MACSLYKHSVNLCFCNCRNTMDRRGLNVQTCTLFQKVFKFRPRRKSPVPSMWRVLSANTQGLRRPLQVQLPHKSFSAATDECTGFFWKSNITLCGGVRSEDKAVRPAAWVRQHGVRREQQRRLIILEQNNHTCHCLKIANILKYMLETEPRGRERERESFIWRLNKTQIKRC